jgi:hypothetical protein
MRMRKSRDNISEYFSVQESNPVPLEDEDFRAVIFKDLWRTHVTIVKVMMTFFFSRFHLKSTFPTLAVLYQVEKFVYNKTRNVRMT